MLGWQAGYHRLLPQPVLDGLDPAQRVPRWTATVRQAAWPGRGTLVADDAGEIAGFADVRPTRDEDQDPAEVSQIASFYVRPSVWRRGVGRSLMTAAVRTLGEAGFATATLWVLETNERAIAFYTRTGWRPDGAVKGDVVGGAAIRDRRYRLALR